MLTNSSEENKAFKTDSDRREKGDHQRALFKMAASSTSATPSPTTATAFVTRTVTVKLLVVMPSLKPLLEVLLATVHATAQRHLIEVKYSVARTTGFILLY